MFRSDVKEVYVVCFFFQAEDGIRDAQESRGLGDVYKRQIVLDFEMPATLIESHPLVEETRNRVTVKRGPVVYLSLIHI